MGNRGRLTVQPGAAWQHYQFAAPPGWEMLGVVQRDDRIGALARSRVTGMHVMLQSGVASSLDDRKVLAALAASEVQKG